MRSRHRGWSFLVGSVAIICAAISWLYLITKVPQDSKSVTSAEDEVYEAVVRDMTNSRLKDPKITEFVFLNSVDASVCSIDGGKGCEDGIRQRLRAAADGRIRADTIEDFIRQSQITGPLSTTFHADLPRSICDPDKTYKDIIPFKKGDRQPFGKVFPGAQGFTIFLSHVGFDSPQDEAIVSASFNCGMLCGEGWRYVLRKKHGKWVVADSWLVWIS